jgi:hypothetical protein
MLETPIQRGSDASPPPLLQYTLLETYYKHDRGLSVIGIPVLSLFVPGEKKTSGHGHTRPDGYSLL